MDNRLCDVAFKNAFMIASAGAVVSFSCQTQAAKQKWMEDIDNACSLLQNSYYGLHEDDCSSEREKEGYLVYAQGSSSWTRCWCSFTGGVLHICDSYVSRSSERCSHENHKH